MKINSLKVSLFFIITLSIFLIISGLLVYKNAVGFLTAWNQANKMVIYLKVDTTDVERQKLITELKAKPDISKVEVVDRAQAAKSFQSSLKEFSSGLITDDEMLDLIPETLEVDLSTSLNLKEREAAFSSLNDYLKTNTSVEDTNYGAAGLKKFERIDNFLRSTGLFVCFILVLSISYLVALMVKVYIDDSKAEIEVYSLLGATRWSIYKLFLKDIFAFLATSLFFAFGALLLVFIYLKDKLQNSELTRVVTDSLRFLTLQEILIVAALLFVFVYINSFLTIQNSVTKLNQLSND
jgi:cell division protein FtsX